eukprot:g27714.t1
MVVAAGRGVVVAGGGGGGGGAAAVGGCGGCCFEADPESQRTEERWVYKGAGQGSYSQVANMEMVGAGRGEFEKEKSTTVAGYRRGWVFDGVSSRESWTAGRSTFITALLHSNIFFFFEGLSDRDGPMDGYEWIL